MSLAKYSNLTQYCGNMGRGFDFCVSLAGMGKSELRILLGAEKAKQSAPAAIAANPGTRSRSYSFEQQKVNKFALSLIARATLILIKNIYGMAAVIHDKNEDYVFHAL